MRVLIVEDHLDVLECMRLYFSEQGHEVHVASTQIEATAWLNCFTPDIAFVDMGLPQGHGLDVIREIQRRRKTPLKTRIVVVTACDDLKLREQALSLGVSDYLFKPLALHDLEALFAGPEQSQVAGQAAPKRPAAVAAPLPPWPS